MRPSFFRHQRPMTLLFDLSTSKLLCQYISSKFKHYVVFRFQVNVITGQTDGRTDGRGVTRNTAFWGGRIKTKAEAATLIIS